MPKSKVRKKKKSKFQRNEYIKLGNNIKMSEIILDYVALTPEEKKQEHKLEVIEIITDRLDITEEDTKDLVEIMLQRKYEEFNDIRRFIRDYDILYKGGEHVLNISSSEV